MRSHQFVSLFGGMATAWSLAAHAQESATMGTTKAPTAASPRIENGARKICRRDFSESSFER
jgi:hypothetical protein